MTESGLWEKLRELITNFNNRSNYLKSLQNEFQSMFNRLSGKIEETKPEEPAVCVEEFTNEK